MKQIVGIGNCQVLSLLYYIKSLLHLNDEYTFTYCLTKQIRDSYDAITSYMYNNSIYQTINFVDDDKKIIETVKNADILIYQRIDIIWGSIEFNNNADSIKIHIPSIYFDAFFNNAIDFATSVTELTSRENKNNVDIIISDFIVNNHEKVRLFFSKNHPTTIIFLHLLYKICEKIHVNCEIDYKNLLKNSIFNLNYTNLPGFDPYKCEYPSMIADNTISMEHLKLFVPDVIFKN
jgi:hypothetical protein